jgi:gliding motility-associated-like protein
VNDTLVITEQPANAIVCEGNNTQFTVHANGVTSYQWQKDEVNIPGKTSSTLIINNVAATDSGVYRCILFSDCDTLSTDGALLTVKIIPQIVLQPLPAGICDGQQIQFDADAVGSNITWQWMKNGVPVGNGNGISGASTQTMVINPVEITDGGVYSARATGYCGVDNTDPVLLTVNPSPVIISQPQPVTVCETQSASFSVAVTGATGYQWQKDNIDLPGKTNATLLLPNINPADGGIYTCRISGTCGTITTNGAQLTVNRKVTITQQPANASLCEGDQATLLITATGTNLSYQWKQDGVILADDGILSGSNNDALKINPLNSSHAGIYQCVVTGSCGSMNSNAAAIAVLEQTVITSHPVSVITCSGNTATFGVRAKGSNLAFQWQKDGTDIPGAVNSDLSINTVSTADSGLYRCVVTGSCGQAFSNAARLTIDVLPSILSQPPATLRICDGNLLTAGITAQGSNLNYQWFFNSTALVDGTGITGSNSPAFSINAVSVSDEGVFYCEVGNACSSIATSGMQVWIDAPLTITEQPANTHACAGDDITLTITATGENITYQWQKNNVDIAGETNSVLHLNALASNDSGTYQCVVSSVCDIVVSAAARVYVSDPTAISVNPPAMVALCQGTMLSISVTATGDILSYQWKRNGTNLVNDGRTTGSQSANLQISGLLPSDAGMYMCEITGTCNIVNTTTSTVDVNIQPVVIFPPSDYSVLDGGNALFTVTAGGDNLTWQWYFNGSAITNGGALSGATTNSLSITGATAANQGTYNAVITGMCGFTTSNPASLTILSSSVITGQPAGDIKCEGESTTLSVVASGAGHTYQWKKNGSDVTNNARIAGAQQASLTISNLTVSDAGSYSCLVDGIENSIPALLYVNRITSVTSVFGAGSFCSGEAITLFVQASGDSLDYAWYKEAGALTDNATIAGSITPALVINPVTPLNSGSYTCRITGACGNTITNPQVIKISDGAVITAQPNDTAICEGQTLNLNVTAAGTDVNWQWYKNGNALADNAHISGSNSQMFQITSITGTDAGAYTCVVSNSCNTDFSTVVNVTVKPLVIISQQPVSTGKCAGDLVTFSVVSNIASATYQWQKNGTSLNDNATIAGSQSALLRISNLQTTDEGSYQCVVTALCNSVTSSPATLEVSNLTTISAQSGDATICEGQSHNFTVTVTGDNLVYQWFRNDLPIIAGIHYSGNNTSALQVINATESEEGVYHCVVTGICQQKVSMPAVLTINNPVSIISQPSGRQLCEGNNLSLSVTANGTGIMYQWQKDNIDLADGGNITGVNGPVLQIANATATTSGNYRCNLVGICSSISTQPATIQVMTAPAITLQPAGMSVCEGNNVLLQTSATGSPSIYTWLLNGDTVTNGGNISGANTAELYIQTIASSFAGIYNYNLTNICGSVNSTPVTVNVNQHGIIILQPQSEQKCLGDQVSFSVTATGNNLNYKWQFQGVDLVDGVGITGSGTMSLTLSDLALADQGTYRCIITDGCGITINSNPAGLTVYEPTAITGIPAGDTLCAGQSISLSITATGSNLTFQWFKNGTALADGTGVSGSNAATLILNNLTLSMSGFYTCRVTGSCNSIISSAIPVLVYLPVQITDQPDNITICSGTNVVFSVVASGDSIKYQWIRDGNRLTDNGIINGAHSSLLMLTSVTSAEAGSYYCEVSGACGIVNSQSAVLTVNAYPAAAGTISGDAVVCQGSEGKIYIVAAIPNADYYKWTLPPGMVITSGENTRQITVSFSENETGGPMSVAGINGCGAGTSSPILNITANPLPVVYAGESTGICNSEGLLSAYDPGAAATGLWQVISGPALIDQPAQAVTAVSQLRNGANNFTWTVTLNGCSLSDTVTINNNRLMVDAGQDTSVCDHIFTFHAAVPASGIGQWSIIKGAGYNINRFDPHSMVTGLAQGANIFKWSVNYNGCISYDTVVVTNNLPTEAEAGIDRFIQADNINLNANNPSVGSGEWSLLNGAAVISDPLLYNTLVTGLGQGKNIFEWRILYNGCISSDTVVIENALMDTTDAGPNQIICSSSVRLGAKNPYPGYGEWSVKRGSATFANNGLYNTYAYNLSQGENVLVWTAYLNGKTSDSVIIINNLPTTANAGISSSVCADTLKLNSNIPYIGTGSWTVVSGSGIFDNGLSNNTMVRSMARGNNNYKWTITNGTCTSSSVVTVTNNKPSDADAGFGAVTCEDTLILNPNTPTFGVGEWSVYSGSAKFSGNMVYDLGRDDNRLIYTIRNSSCYSHDTLVITSHKPTPARLGPDQSICADSVLIVANAPQTGTGIWSLQSGSASIEDISSPSTMARNMTMGENVLRWTVTYQECSSYDDITISNDFVRADAGLDQTLCSGRTILQANDPGYSTGNWTIIGGSTGATILNPHASTSVAENLAQGANVLRWTISKNTCVSYDEVTLTNNNPTVAFAGEDAYLCSNVFQLRANSISIGNGTWSILSGSGSLVDTHNPVATINNLGSGNNLLRWTSENAGCVSTDEVMVTNNLPVNVFAGLNQTLCDDSTILYANPPALGTGTWSVIQGSAIFTNPQLYNTTVVHLGNGDNRLKWTVATTGCSVTDTVVITNNLPSVAVAGSDFPVCNSVGTLSANTPLFGTGRWSLISGAGSITNPTSARTVINDLALGENMLQWTITKGNCISSDELLITNNSPTIADAGENEEACGESAILYANSPVVGTGYWTVMSGTGVFTDSLNYNTAVNGLTFGENTLRWTTQNGACMTIDEITITNNLAYIYAGEDKVVYEPHIILTGNNPGMGTSEWILIAGAGNLAVPSGYTTEVTGLGAGLNTFEWTITNGSCTARDQVVINYKVMPKVGFAVSDLDGCPGLTIDFINTTQYGTTYRWELGDGSVTTDVNPSHTYQYADNYVVKLTAFGPDNQLVTTDTVITIHVKPIATFQFAPDTAFVNKPVRCYDNSFGDISVYSWDFGDSEISGEKNPLHYYKQSGDFTITLMVNSAFGCTDTTSRTIFVAEDGLIIFPNAFTPNINGSTGGQYDETDRSNDVFHPYHENVGEFHMEIYSRWGVLLFETDDINIGWDGYYKGQLLAKDVYVWRARGKYVSGSEFLKTGTVLLIK